jgi:hypothetical protein
VVLRAAHDQLLPHGNLVLVGLGDLTFGLREQPHGRLYYENMPALDHSYANFGIPGGARIATVAIASNLPSAHLGTCAGASPEVDGRDWTHRQEPREPAKAMSAINAHPPGKSSSPLPHGLGQHPVLVAGAHDAATERDRHEGRSPATSLLSLDRTSPGRVWRTDSLANRLPQDRPVPGQLRPDVGAQSEEPSVQPGCSLSGRTGVRKSLLRLLGLSTMPSAYLDCGVVASGTHLDAADDERSV